MVNQPVNANAAGKQPADIAVKCGNANISQSGSKPSCTIIVTYDDWSTDVAYYKFKGTTGPMELTGAISQITQDGGYKAVTDCAIPASNNTTNCATFGLKNKPAALPNTNAPTVMQMPTTGAPEGLSTVGLVAVGLGMLAIGIGLARRERF